MRFPVLPTLFVAAAVATMIALGLWQIGRAQEKDALAARFAANRSLPAMALPVTAAADEALLYRRATAFCLEVTSWRRVGGKAASGRTGTRHIASCRTGAEGPGFVADLGVSADPKFVPQWKGGEVTGVVSEAPSDAGFIQRLTGKAPPPRPMIVAAEAAAGLEPTVAPQPPAENSSRWYAGQWFFFAFTAALIYLLALRRRRTVAVEAEPKQP
ncbi:MAG TPA: SURF1 family cytochrome oxidase biogenesis protein [Allosphingosinicella sp.]|jgi:cytochrome oxidase assembly protein ShyY1